MASKHRPALIDPLCDARVSLRTSRAASEATTGRTSVGATPPASPTHHGSGMSWARRSRALGTSTGPPAPVASLDVASADWRTLVLWAPDVAVERLARDIGSGRFHHGGLRARAQDLRAHLRPEIRERARTEFVTALDMGDDGPGPGTRFD